MLIITVFGWVGTICILVSYFLSSRHGKRIFDWANALLFIPVGLPALLLHAYNAAAISASFGLIAVHSLWVERAKRPELLID